VERLEAAMTEGWPCWAVSNHDVQRAVTRWGGDEPSSALAAQLVALVCSLRGSVCLYQGEELGLPEAEVPYADLQDPYGKAFWPNFKGRDGCRTPMPWNDDAHSGFSAGKPWLPIPQAHRAINVAAQERDPHSVLQQVRRFLAWRRQQPALQNGSIHFHDAPEPILAFTRASDGQRLLVVFNLSAQAQQWRLPQPLRDHAASTPEFGAGHYVDGELSLPPRGVWIARID